MTDQLDRLAELVARLETLGHTGASPSPTSVNPDGSPGPVASGEIVAASWGNSVSTTVGRLWNGRCGFGVDYPTTNKDAGGTDTVATIWGSKVITVPSWATRALVRVQVSGAFESGGTGAQFALQLRTTTSGGVVYIQGQGATKLVPISWSDFIVVAPGAVTFSVWAARVAGTGAGFLRAPADGSSFRFDIDYFPAALTGAE